ncbi:YitT family protein [Streptococcus merionis]|uniref:YitT family protein n=1 Tax=Streptococcus merionis TaxID=400065 RepID=UPI003516A7A9
MKTSKYYRFFRKKILRLAREHEILKVLISISREKYAERLTGSIMYGLLSAIAVNVFYAPSGVYSSGATGLAQIMSSLVERFWGVHLPIAIGFYVINVPLLLLAWYKIGQKFTIFTFLTVTMSAFFIHFVPQITLTDEPLLNAIFGAIFMGAGVGYALKNRVSSGGTDIVSILVRKKTGKNVGVISTVVNLCIVTMAGLLFGWEAGLYSMVAVFVSGRVVDAVYVKQKKMQAMIITNKPERVIARIHKKLHRGVTIINEAEGAYNHEKKAVLITIITQAEFNDFKYHMRKADPAAFISVAENIQIIGRFVEDET